MNVYNQIAGVAMGILVLWCIAWWAIYQHRQKTRCKYCGGKFNFIDYSHSSGAIIFKCFSCELEERRSR